MRVNCQIYSGESARTPRENVFAVHFPSRAARSSSTSTNGVPRHESGLMSPRIERGWPAAEAAEEKKSNSLAVLDVRSGVLDQLGHSLYVHGLFRVRSVRSESLERSVLHEPDDHFQGSELVEPERIRSSKWSRACTYCGFSVSQLAVCSPLRFAARAQILPALFNNRGKRFHCRNLSKFFAQTTLASRTLITQRRSRPLEAARKSAPVPQNPPSHGSTLSLL